MTITKKIGIMVAACTVASSIAVGALSLVDSNQFMTSNAEAIMNAECNNIAADIEAYLGKVELSVDTLSDIALNSIGDFNKFKTDSSYVSDYTSNMEQTLMNSASNTEGAVCAYQIQSGFHRAYIWPFHDQEQYYRSIPERYPDGFQHLRQE